MARACTGAWSCCGALAALCLLCLCPEACFSQAAHEIPAPRRARELSFTHGGRNVSALERALAQKEERELAAAAAAAPSSPGEDGTARWCATERLRPCPKNARALEVDDDGIGELRRQLARGYDVMLVGDSLTRQWFEAVACDLSLDCWGGWPPYEAFLRSDEFRDVSRAVGARPNSSMTGERKQNQWAPYAVLAVGNGSIGAWNLNTKHRPNDGNRTFKNAHLGPLEAQGSSENAIRGLAALKDVIVVGPSLVHFNVDEDRLREAYYANGTGSEGWAEGHVGLDEHVEFLLRACRDGGRALCALKDATPQAFNTLSGNYGGERKASHGMRCLQSVAEMRARWEAAPWGRWRHTAMLSIARRLDAPVLGSYEAMLASGDMHSMHNGDADCTHLWGCRGVWASFTRDLAALLAERDP